jgi:spore coat polysaccharide biosynthesis protein SpsF
MKKVIIGIQCRTNSERLPGKALLRVSGKTIIERVLFTCQTSAKYVTGLARYNAYCRVALLVPRGDYALINAMKKFVDIIEGPEDDVIARYVKAANTTDADFIVRVTGDCLYLPSHVISRHIKYAIQKDSDYCNNILQRCNPEGWDTEVLSKNLLDWLNINATTPEDREHVTTLIPKALAEDYFPKRFKIHTSKDHLDLSAIKTSIDTKDEYETACREFETRRQKIDVCQRYGEIF